MLILTIMKYACMVLALVNVSITLIQIVRREDDIEKRILRNTETAILLLLTTILK